MVVIDAMFNFFARQLMETSLIKLDKICREANIMLVIARSYGLTGMVRISMKVRKTFIDGYGLDFLSFAKYLWICLQFRPIPLGMGGTYRFARLSVRGPLAIGRRRKPNAVLARVLSPGERPRSLFLPHKETERLPARGEKVEAT
ncbi:hypothetical protein GW17_00020306 [Ensete ventricosum]|nr:hypothetical protein GW17_00020306 [Ensete ventricosum]